jgi:N-acetylmuramoyl-L-alanine amidase
VAANGLRLAFALCLAFALPGFAGGQGGPISLTVVTPEGELSPALTIVGDQGFAAVPAGELARLGWSVSPSSRGVVAHWRGGPPTVELRPGSPFLSWGNDGVQLAEAPYLASGELFIPLQFFIDILTWKMPELFRYDPDTRTLVLGDGVGGSRAKVDPVRVVVIDPGHGGRDPGAKGVGGTLEKDVALSVGRALFRHLQGDPNLRVYLTRDSDTLIPIWKRGELATEWRGDHPGVFVSIHANAMPGSSSTRGFETYFLSEARTDHERRVAALENAAQEFEVEGEGPYEGSDLSFILTELRNLDHQHWSALLAEMVQDRLSQVHPGRNRGVKQGPLAVITNALMPAVLVEVGFLTNRGEERLLTQGDFQENTASALAAAIRDFLLRYPGGDLGGLEGGDAGP